MAVTQGSNTMARTYYTLAVRDTATDAWAAEFGAYDKDDVTAERTDYIWHGTPPRNVKVIKSGAKQADINAAIAKLNGGV